MTAGLLDSDGIAGALGRYLHLQQYFARPAPTLGDGGIIGFWILCIIRAEISFGEAVRRRCRSRFGIARCR